MKIFKHLDDEGRLPEPIRLELLQDPGIGRGHRARLNRDVFDASPTFPSVQVVGGLRYALPNNARLVWHPHQRFPSDVPVLKKGTVVLWMGVVTYDEPTWSARLKRWFPVDKQGWRIVHGHDEFIVLDSRGRGDPTIYSLFSAVR